MSLGDKIRLWLFGVWILGIILLAIALPLPWFGQLGIIILGSILGIRVILA